jgi:hypothetical protein
LSWVVGVSAAGRAAQVPNRLASNVRGLGLPKLQLAVGGGGTAISTMIAAARPR